MIVTYIHSKNPEDEIRVQLRCRNFADAINRIGWHRANLLDLHSFAQNTLEAQEICAASDLLVIHRYLYGSILQTIEYWKARDKKVIVDLDQAINYLSPDIPGYSFWVEGRPFESYANGVPCQENQIDPIPLEQFKWGLHMVDAAIVSSTQLAVDWAQFTDVHEVPDYLNTDQYPAFKHVHENEIWIGLANNTRKASIRNSGLSNALENICRKQPQVKLILCDQEGDAGRILDIDPAQITVFPQNVLEGWADILLKLDIGLVPIYGAYDFRSSRINLLEFMISKIPWIASNQPAFCDYSRYGRLVQNSSNAWEASILKAVDNIDAFRKRATGEPFLFALGQDVNENIDKVLKIFIYIINKRY